MFKVGDKVRVITDKYKETYSHKLTIGGIYTILEYTPASKQGDQACNYQEYRLARKAGWVCEDEIELIEEKQ